LAWAARRWPDAPPASLPAFAARLPAGELATALTTLDRQLYGRAGGNWQAQHLWRAVLRGWMASTLGSDSPARTLLYELPSRRS
jgi:hypothetical protein